MRSLFFLFIDLVTTTLDAYDYIIVGGGTGGLVVANRLSEDPNVSVLIVEAGASVLDNKNVTNVDRYSTAFNTKIDWAYETVSRDFGGRTQIFRAGRALGGMSAINDIRHIRGKNLAERSGPGKSLAILSESENFTKSGEEQIAAGTAFDTEYHSFEGPFQVSFRHAQPSESDLIPVLNKTLGVMGVLWNRDPNGERIRGFTVHPTTIDAREYVLHDAARAYYWPVSSRSNLYVLCNTTVDRIIWEEGRGDKGDLVAAGVKVRDKYGSRFIYAKREVVLAAGVFGSPAILELSGVGNPRILEQYGITTRIDLPTVGENLQEQINSSMIVSTRRNISGSRALAYLSESDILGEDLRNIADSLAVKLPQYARRTADVNGGVVNSTNLQYLFAIQHDLIFRKSVPISEFRINSGNKEINVEYWGLLPFSRGNVHIASADPAVQPVINPNYRLLNFDITVQVAMSKFTRQMFHSKPLNRLVLNETRSGFDRIPHDSPDDVWREWVKEKYLTNYHPIGTLSMLPRSMGGVVDNRLRVYGTSNVRVVDASIHPIQLCGHPTSSIYAIGEMMSDLIKDAWSQSSS